MATTIKIELPLWTTSMSHKEWFKQLTAYYDHHKQGQYLDKSKRPDAEIAHWPFASTAESFVARVCQHPNKVDLCAAAGLTVNATQAKAKKAEDIDDDTLAQYNVAMRRQHKKADKQLDLQETWPIAVKACMADLQLSISRNPDVKRVVEQVDDDDENYFYNVLDKLKEKFGDEKENEKADVLLKHLLMIFNSGDTAAQWADKVRVSLDNAVTVCGGTVTLADLTSTMFEAHVGLFGIFRGVSQQMASLKSATLATKLELFENALRSEGPIVLAPDELKAAMSALVNRCFQDVAAPIAQEARNRGRGRGRNKSGRPEINLGGAARGEGTMLAAAFLAEDYNNNTRGKTGKGAGGKGAAHMNPNRPPNSCGRCFKVGHFARDCTEIPHRESTDPVALAYHRQGLWAGRGNGPGNAMVAQVEEHNGGVDGTAAQRAAANAAFARENPVAFRHHLAVPKNGATTHEANSADMHVAGVSDTFVSPADAELQRRLKRPLNQRRDRPKPSRNQIEMIVDSGCSLTMGPVDEVARLGKDSKTVTDEFVATAGREQPPLPVNLSATIFGSAKVERGHNKAVDCEVRGVAGLGKWLWSVADMYRQNAVVRFCKPEKGIMGIQLDGSEEWIPIEFVNDKYFRVLIDVNDNKQLSNRQKQEANFRTSCLAASLDPRILRETATRGIVRNFEYFPEVSHGTDETSLLVKGQMAPFPKETQYRPKKVGAVTYFDCAKIDKNFAQNSRAKWMLTARDAANNFRRRYYLKSTKNLHLWVRKHRNFLRRKGHEFAHMTADNEFDTVAMEELAAEPPQFDFNFCAPHCHSQNPAESDIKAWRLRVRAVMEQARRDPKSKVKKHHWPYASDCITDIENMSFCAQSPEMTPWESVYREQPDWSVAQIPMCRIWFYVYPDLRKNAPFANHRAEAIFCGICDKSSTLKLFNLATGRVILRRYADCVAREPDEVFDYNDIVTAAEKLYASGKSKYTQDDRPHMFEPPTAFDNFDAIQDGNAIDADVEAQVPKNNVNASNSFDALSAADSDSDSDSDYDSGDFSEDDSDSDSNSNSDSDDDGSNDEDEFFDCIEELDTKLITVGKKHTWTAKRIAASYGVSTRLLAQYNGDANGLIYIVDSTKFKSKTTLNIPILPSSGNDGAVVHEANFAHVLPSAVFTEAALFADSVLGSEDPVVHKVDFQNLPKQVHAKTGEPLEQVVSVNLAPIAQQVQSKAQSLRQALHEVFLADCSIQKQPRSYEAGLKDPAQRPHWLNGDAEEHKRVTDFKAFVSVPYSSAEASGEYIGHVIRVIRIKEVAAKGVVVEREYKVRWAYDESRDPNDDGAEHFAGVLRTQTSRLLNLKACRLKRRVIRGDLVSAFLHIVADKPFYTRFPKGHPDEFKNGVRQAMKWTKLLYGKGTASRGLWHDFAATLMSLGFVQQREVDMCLFIHPTRDIDFGLYVDDLEASASDEQLEWLMKMIQQRYEVKWLGYNTKDCPESNEKSKTFVGIRTEIDHARQIMTQDQTQLIQKSAEKFKWDGRKRYAPPVRNEQFPDVENGAKICPIFHKRYRSKVGFVAHIAVQTRMDINQHAVKAARRLNDPVPECETYIDESFAVLIQHGRRQA